MKRINLRSINAVLLTAFLLIKSQTIFAQQVFSVGDRVLVSPSSLRDEQYWRRGTVTEVHNFTPKKAYTVVCDPQTKGGSSSSFIVNQDWIKSLPAEQTAAPVPNEPTHTPQQPGKQNLVQQGGSKIACPSSDPDTKGGTHMEQVIRGAIREGWEREPELGADGKVTVTFQNVVVGSSHTWDQLRDPIDAHGKDIYSVRASFTTCTDYNTRIVLVKRERAFGCYNKGNGKWSCEVVAAANTNVKDQSQSIDKKK